MNTIVVFDYVNGKEKGGKLLTNDESRAQVAKSRKRLKRIINKLNRTEREEDKIRFSSLVRTPKHFRLRNTRHGKLKANERVMLSLSELLTRDGAMAFQAESFGAAIGAVTEIVEEAGLELLKKIDIIYLE